MALQDKPKLSLIELFITAKTRVENVAKSDDFVRDPVLNAPEPASFLCETTNFCVPFLRTCLLKSEKNCVQCTDHRLKFCMGLFRNSKN